MEYKRQELTMEQVCDPRSGELFDEDERSEAAQRISSRRDTRCKGY